MFWHGAGKNGVRLRPLLRDRLAKIHKQFLPSEMYVAWDTPGTSWRKTLWPAYKATRSEKPETLVEQLAECEHGICDLATSLGADEFEADDVLATAAAIAEQRSGLTVIASRDKDLRQCLRKGVVAICRDLRSDAHGKLVATWITEDSMAGDDGLSPSQCIDYQTLVGDGVDNVPGCPGIGDKTAKDLLRRAGGIDAVVENPWKFIPRDKLREKFLAWVRDGRMSLTRELVTLYRDVPGIGLAM